MHKKKLLAIAIAVLVLVVATGARRRAAGPPSCPAPSLSLTVSPAALCASDVVTLTWEASEPSAVVVIEGVGKTLPKRGSMQLVTGPRSFTGYASNGCRSGSRVTATVAARAINGSVTGPGSLTQGSSATLAISVDCSACWTIASSLGNSISPSAGCGSQTATYVASQSGNDAVVLSITAPTGERIDRSTTISVPQSTTTPPPPPPPSGGLLCCDGTRSPSCFSCGNKSGCCSGHKGVCGC